MQLFLSRGLSYTGFTRKSNILLEGFEQVVLHIKYNLIGMDWTP